MKPFVLEEALAGKPVVTRSGLKVTQIVHFEAITEYPIFAVVDHRITSYRINGFKIESGDSYLDLFMAPEKRTIWLNVTKEGFASGWPTK